MKKKLTTSEFIEKARKIHGYKYDYSKVNYKDTKTKVCIICPEHGEFFMKPNKHLSAMQGCPECGKESSRKKQVRLQEEFIEKCKEVHGDRYDYSKVNYVNNRTKVEIICSIHGSFRQLPIVHLNRVGNCPKCSHTTGNQISKEEFIKKCREIHGDRYDYSKVNYVNNKTKVEIICPIHGSFYQTPRAHLCKKHGCPYCKESQLERDIRLLLTNNNIKYEYQKSWDWLVYKSSQYVDYYLPELNLVIECQGKQHFEPSEFFNKDATLEIIQDRDRNKYEKCKEHGYDIIYYSNIHDVQKKYSYPYKVYEKLKIY